MLREVHEFLSALATGGYLPATVYAVAQVAQVTFASTRWRMHLAGDGVCRPDVS